ncbi:MAG: hypothetical protein Q8O92_04995 [Candidatus Latescibacter sp.]|nr:hypothetical protein [Candidatus Latescibacter sp.]
MKNKIIYSLNVEDIQHVVNEELDRDLTDKEIALVENKIGDYIDWYEAINSSIHESVGKK